ncbi:quinone oxidoreductase family protein [Streptomyces olivaceus]|uniref:quinone oxidoreductase family protein n=1 Tax=Streptomyces olivaceus TaxID=47716 RepID=UPI00405785B8
MKAVIVPSFGDSHVLRVVDQAEPRPGPNQVLIKVEAAGVGYVDVMARNGAYQPLSEPGFSPGLEAAGTVTAVGEGVPRDWVGQQVFALTGSGAYAESVVVDACDIVRRPEGVSAADAVALGVNALVASIALKRANLMDGERVLVRGAGGGIGVMAVQLAALYGGVVTAITSSPARGIRLRSLGAAHVQDRTTDQDSGTFDIIVDPVAGQDTGRWVEKLRPNGRYLLLGAAGGAPTVDTFNSILATYHNSPSLHAFSLNSIDPGTVGAAATAVFHLVAQGGLRAVIDDEVPLAEAHRAHERLESTPVFGKIVLRP